MPKMIEIHCDKFNCHGEENYECPLIVSESSQTKLRQRLRCFEDKSRQVLSVEKSSADLRLCRGFRRRVNNRVTRRRDEQQLPSKKFMSRSHETACKLIRTRDARYGAVTVEWERYCDSFLQLLERQTIDNYQRVLHPPTYVFSLLLARLFCLPPVSVVFLWNCPYAKRDHCSTMRLIIRSFEEQFHKKYYSYVLLDKGKLNFTLRRKFSCAFPLVIFLFSIATTSDD